MTARSEDALATTLTVSSVNSDHSTEHLISEPLQLPKCSESVTVVSDEGNRVSVVVGAALAVSGALLAGAGGLALVKGAALARVCAGLWAGGAGVVAGVVGVLAGAGAGDCNGVRGHAAGPSNRGALSAFLALSLMALAGGQAAAALGAAGLQRDVHRPASDGDSFQEEMRAWWPVLSNACVLCAAAVQMVLSAVAAWTAARRVCGCWTPKGPYDHNQFEPGKDCVASKEPTLALVDEASARQIARQIASRHSNGNHKDGGVEWGSANSRSRLVSRWLVTGPRPTGPALGHALGPGPGGGRKPRPAPLMLLPVRPPPHPNTTLGRPTGPPCMMVGPRYATLPLPPAPYPVRHHMQPLYYPVHDTRMRRRRSPRGPGGVGGGRRRAHRGPSSQLTRSLERIQRRKDRQRDTEAELKRTYTGLDRAYAEQFIAVCDESRHATEHPDSLPTSSSETSHS